MNPYAKILRDMADDIDSGKSPWITRLCGTHYGREWNDNGVANQGIRASGRDILILGNFDLPDWERERLVESLRCLIDIHGGDWVKK